MRIRNESAETVTYGRGYGIERHSEQAWRAIELPPVPVPMVGLVAPPGELGPPIAVRVPAEAEPGRYRVVLAQPAKGAPGSLAAEFEVR